MKSLIHIFALLSSLVSIEVFSQTPNNCEFAVPVMRCETFPYSTKAENCYGGVNSVFFRFEAQSTISTGSLFFYTISASATNSYIIYGPFSDNDNICDLINNYQAPVLAQGNGNNTGNTNLTFSVQANKRYIIRVQLVTCNPITISMVDASPVGQPISKCSDNISVCEECIPKFLPTNGKYVLSAWVKEDAAPSSTTTYTKPSIIVTAGGTALPAFTPTGQIIDGWQRVEGVFTTTSIQSIQVELKATGGTCYFDDIRIFPFDGSMMSYVYDPISLRLVAELDERNYAKFYEYDEEGKLIRVKKETEKGIMTIQENRENNAVR